MRLLGYKVVPINPSTATPGLLEQSAVTHPWRPKVAFLERSVFGVFRLFAGLMESCEAGGGHGAGGAVPGWTSQSRGPLSQ